MTKILFIDARKKEISAVFVPKEKALFEMQRLVDGYVQMVLHLENRHALLVDEDGLANRCSYGFALVKDPSMIYVGNGIVSASDEEGDTTDVTMELEALKKMIKFHSIQG